MSTARGFLVLVVAVLVLSLVAWSWAKAPDWEVLAAVFEVMTGLGLLSLTFFLWAREEKRDRVQFAIPAGTIWTEPRLLHGTTLRVQFELLNHGLRDSEVWFAELGITMPGAATRWDKVGVQRAHDPTGTDLMVRAGGRLRLEAVHDGIEAHGTPSQLAQAQLSLRVTPVLGEPVTQQSTRFLNHA